MRKWVPWVPLLMFGSLVYWTVALNFGGLSLMRLSSTFFSMGNELGPCLVDDDYPDKDSFQPITVHLAGQDELGLRTADDVPLTVDVVSDHDTARADQRGAGDRGGRADTGPGNTAF
ncbi:MAG TPA: hypothetical protein VHU40_13735 [Polyangia bacterium]|nr:hypothetical protein [Polyangia bacterium]